LPLGFAWAAFFTLPSPPRQARLLVSGELFVFRGRRGDLIKILGRDGQGLCLFSKRLEKGRFIWPQTKDGAVSLTAAQLSMLLDHPC
jgi:transposase